MEGGGGSAALFVYYLQDLLDVVTRNACARWHSRMPSIRTLFQFKLVTRLTDVHAWPRI
jgi:hypothetical protein